MMVKKYFDRLKSVLPKSKSSLLIFLGIIGLLLILLSSIGNDNNDSSADTEVKASVEVMTKTEDYIEKTEARLESVISDMLGGTRVSVMITLENGVEYVYASEVKTDADVKKDQMSLKTEQSDSNQKKYVVVKDSNGNEQALVVTEKMPVIRGVVIVCDSGQTDRVSLAVKTAVKSALQISDEKICIIGRY